MRFHHVPEGDAAGSSVEHDQERRGPARNIAIEAERAKRHVVIYDPRGTPLSPPPARIGFKTGKGGA